MSGQGGGVNNIHVCPKLFSQCEREAVEAVVALQCCGCCRITESVILMNSGQACITVPAASKLPTRYKNAIDRICKDL